MATANTSWQTNGKGNLSEARVLTAYSAAGFVALLPFGNGAPYDLAIDLGHRILKVQVKTGRLRGGCVLFAVQRIGGHRRSRRKRYTIGEFDVFAIYCPDNDKIYIQSLEESLSSGRLRCEGTKNSQKQNVRWAKDYEFEIHIERLRQEQEAVLRSELKE